MKKELNYAVSKNENDNHPTVTLPHYSPYSFTTKDYVLYDKLRSFEQNFEAMCRQFIKETSPDRFNKSYFDAVIEKYCNEAIRDIDEQRLEHIVVISQSIAGSQKGSRIEKQEEIQILTEEIKNKTEELAKYKRLYYKGTSFQED
ncbi:MAG: hypothetical protein E7241_00015 [Lachnospiraceae bacterium]|nr:hypothetical protein [Lachnospiraceae bacterium]